MRNQIGRIFNFLPHRHLLRRSVAIYERYFDDPSYRTEVHVISLLFALTLAIALIILVLFEYNSARIADQILTSDAKNSISNALALISETYETRLRTLEIGLIIALIVDVVFGYLIAYFALQPTRSAMEAQKRFIRNIAHELRTPLSIIKLNSEMSLIDPSQEEGGRSARSNIEELDRISLIIDNLLTISALSKPEPPSFGPIVVREIVTHTISKYEALARSHNVRVTLEDGESSTAWASKTALEQIVGNVVKNAIVYTPEGGSVTISIQRRPDQFIEVRVRDTGIGISQKDIDHIFDPFFRADPSRTRSSGGSGLGLTIASELAKMQHGSISVRSKLGKGTVVTVKIPCIRNNAARAKVVL